MAEKKDEKTTLLPNMKTPQKTTLLWKNGEKEGQDDYPTSARKRKTRLPYVYFVFLEDVG